MHIIKVESLIDILKSKEAISKFEEVGTSGTSGKKGVNKSWRLTNDKGEQFLFKPKEFEHTSRWRYIPAHSQYKREKAFYLLDRKLGFNLVPETFIKKYTHNDREYIGSCHRWIDAEHIEGNTDSFVNNLDDKQLWEIGLSDLIGGNVDRHGGNILVKLIEVD